MIDKPVGMVAATGIAVGLALGVLGAAGYGALSADPPAGEAQAAGLVQRQSATPDSLELTATLRDLTTVLASIEDLLQRERPQDRAAHREPIDTPGATNAPSPSSDPALARSLAEIAAALRALQDPGNSPRSANGLTAPAQLDRSTVFDSAAMKAASLVDDDAGWDRAHAAFFQKHLLWSQQDILSAYGKPDAVWISDKGVATWDYVVRTPGEGEEDIRFRLHEGVVHDVDYDFDVEDE